MEVGFVDGSLDLEKVMVDLSSQLVFYPDAPPFPVYVQQRPSEQLSLIGPRVEKPHD